MRRVGPLAVLHQLPDHRRLPVQLHAALQPVVLDPLRQLARRLRLNRVRHALLRHHGALEAGEKAVALGVGRVDVVRQQAFVREDQVLPLLVVDRLESLRGFLGHRVSRHLRTLVHRDADRVNELHVRRLCGPCQVYVSDLFHVSCRFYVRITLRTPRGLPFHAISGMRTVRRALRAP